MTSKEAAEHIGVSINTLRKYVHEEGLPVLRFPGRRKWTFREDLIDEWMVERSKPEVIVMSKDKEDKPKEYGKLRVLTP
ncbi:helix-turn-helix domain-containing protein [Sporosarcina contaminans]|uniref:Helix-turn-helix domain-containing protein n=1 Tax=Sporosarcina contaminans TaxID=633403 RepID=A0ABW3U0R2_9BACL